MCFKYRQSLSFVILKDVQYSASALVEYRIHFFEVSVKQY